MIYHNGSEYTFTWTQGRRLATATMGAYDLSFEYNESGIRTSKTVNGITHEYVVDGTKIISDCWLDSAVRHYIAYIYDAKGVIGMVYRNHTMDEDEFEYYLFEKNLQGDITAVYDEYGGIIVEYTYDAWGNVTETLYDTTSNGQYNSFRYRGYFYDEDLGLYYLNSRYYDPATGRFLNADVFINANGDLTGFNMYAYCSNNPVMFVDLNGDKKIAVLYDGRQSGFFGIGGDGFDRQGRLITKSLSKENDVTSVSFSSIEEFVERWNQLEDEYDEIYIIAHGYIGSIDCNGGRLVKNATKDEHIPISRLNPKKVKDMVYLYSCNGATLNAFGESAALMFAEITQSRVKAVRDGKLNISWTNGEVDPVGGYWHITSPFKDIRGTNRFGMYGIIKRDVCVICM